MIVFDNITDYLLAFISAILGISIPLMLQVIEKLDERYKSTRLSERIRSEKIVKISIRLLFAALLTCTYAIFCRFSSLWDLWILNNSADVIAIICCCALIISFLLSCKIILLYYSPRRLQDRILNAFEGSVTYEDRERNFLDWVDITRTLFSSSDRDPAIKVFNILKTEIDKALSDSKKKTVLLPDYLVKGITSINENLCLMPRRPYSINNGNQILKLLISKPSKISDDLYRILWKNLQLQLFYNQEDWVYEYWSGAVEIYVSVLKQLHKGEKDYSNQEVIISEEDVKRREEERGRYREFHIILCATIFREKRYDLLERILNYSCAMTPEYEYPLIPSTLDEILDAFKLAENSPRLDIDVQRYYPMRGIKGIVESKVLGSVKQYLTFLYIRLFSNIGKRKNLYVNYPTTRGRLKHLNEDIDYITRLMPALLRNNELIDILSFIGKDGIEKEMLSVIDKIKEEIENKEKELRTTNPNEDEIVKENLGIATKMIKSEMAAYELFSNKKNDEAKCRSYYIRGVNSYLYPNIAFQHDAGINYVDMAESVTGASINSFRHYFASVFYQEEQKKLRVSSNNIFQALDKLQIDKNFVIISFDIYWDYYLQEKIRGFRKDEGAYSYKGIPIICLNGGPSRLVSQTIYIIKRCDIPSLRFIPPIKEHIERYELDLQDEDYKFYGSIVQLSKNAELLKDVDNMSKEEAEEYSLFNVFLNAQMNWQIAAPVVSVKLMYSMVDNGTSESLDAVLPFEKMFEM